MDIDGDEFAEADYGLVVDNSQGTQELAQKLDMLAQAALQNQALSFSTIMRLYNSSSLAEKQRLVERDEQAIQARNAQAQQQQLQAQQQIAQLENEQRLAEMQQKEQANIRDNETKIIVAQIQANSKEDGISEPETDDDRANLREKIREFDEKMRLEKEKLSFEREKHSDDVRIKEKSLKKNKNTNSNK